jgi:hypothetical protein
VVDFHTSSARARVKLGDGGERTAAALVGRDALRAQALLKDVQHLNPQVHDKHGHRQQKPARWCRRCTAWEAAHGVIGCCGLRCYARACSKACQGRWNEKNPTARKTKKGLFAGRDTTIIIARPLAQHAYYRGCLNTSF